MRCKVGDLAVIVRDEFLPNVGKFVTVLRPAKWPYSVQTWECSPHGDITANVCAEDGTHLYVDTSRRDVDMPDTDLRPIRHPGDDAIDEVVQKLGSPAWSDAYGVKV